MKKRVTLGGAVLGLALLLGQGACTPKEKHAAGTKPDASTGQTGSKPSSAEHAELGAKSAQPSPAKRQGRLEGASLQAMLLAHVKHWGLSDLDDSWALAHALLVLPATTVLSNGKHLSDQLLSFASWRELDGKSFPVFLGTSSHGTPREPHHNLTLRSLLQAGLPFDTPFVAAGHATSLDALYEGAEWQFELPPLGKSGREAWSLGAFALGVGRGKPMQFVNHKGVTIRLTELAIQATEEYGAANAFLKVAREQGTKLVKRRQGIFAEPCGGWHFLEGVDAWIPDPTVGALLKPKLQLQIELAEYRIHAEGRLYDATHQSAPAKYRRLLWIQELKFYGHYLEAMGQARDEGLSVSSQEVDFAKGRIAKAVDRLQGFGAFEQMKQLRSEREQSYLDMIGDSAHALAGLRAWSTP